MFLRLITLLFLLMLVNACGQEYASFDEMASAVAKGKVPEIYAEELNQLKGVNNFAIIDVREKEEFQISHIKNAKNIPYKHFDINAFNSIDKQTKMIIYCSVGYRSEKVGEQLLAAGFKKIFNLYGGIFGWINADYPIYDHQEKQTLSIHPYNNVWGKWLTKGETVYE